MNRNVWTVLFVILGSICLYSCSSVRHLPPGQSMLVKNEVKVVDAKSPDFDNLRTYVRPVTNKKFMDLFRIKTVFYDWGQPTYDKNGNTKDGKFKKFLREKAGEPPVLLDSMEIKNSVDQLKIVMKQIGYFDADVDYKVTYRRKDHKKSKVDYFITAHDPYTISKINYDISIPEYKRIVVLNMRKSVLYDGMQYNENRINDELTRIINLIRNEGYYYVEKSIMRCNVEYDPPDSSGVNPRSVHITILLNIPQGDNASRYLYKYHINDIYVNPDMPSLSASDAVYDTTFYPYHTRRDSSRLYFIEERLIGEVRKPYFSYKKLSDAIFTRTGQNYSQMYRDLSSRALNSLDNFDYINILFKENEALLDTVNKTGALDVYYRMIRKKRHTFGGQVELRNDKSAISLVRRLFLLFVEQPFQEQHDLLVPGIRGVGIVGFPEPLVPVQQPHQREHRFTQHIPETGCQLFGTIPQADVQCSPHLPLESVGLYVAQCQSDRHQHHQQHRQATLIPDEL